ncbi:MAG TPA: NHL repeat-containing protein, partial [Candidatus Latescibacteria bacterium]|nr:NHL repeat-containing protein [Candidatus Latescibacterota bacterium]
YPNGIALNVDASIWCTDIDADRLIQLYQETPSELGARIQSTGILSDPAGVACSPDGNIVVADTGNDRIAVFDRFGTLLRTWGEGILLRPRGVNVTPQGDILIADTGNNRLVFLNRMYHLTGEHGSRGSEYGEFLEPCSVASDPAGNVVWVADTGNNRVQVFRVIRTTE